MKNELQVSNSKTLRLNNVLMRELQEDEFEKIDIIVEKMENYIKVNGAMPVGPLIQYSKTDIMNDRVGIKIYIFRQANKYLHSVQQPYHMESVVRVQNCIYCRYIGPESHIGIAGSKLNVLAFEENIKLKGDSYTIYVEQQDDILIADVFMERDDNE